MSGADAGYVQLAVAENGQTVLTWLSRKAQLLARFRTSEGGWGEIQRVSEDRASPYSRPDLDIAADGSAVLAWRGRDGALESATRKPGGRFSRSTTLVQDDGFIRFSAAAAEGQAAVAWARACPPAERVTKRNLVRVNFLGPDSSSRALKVRRSRCNNAGIDLAVDSENNAAVVVNGNGFRFPIKASFGSQGAGFAAAEEIDGRGKSNHGQLEMDSLGRSVAIWNPLRPARRDLPAGTRGIAAAMGAPGGPFGAGSRISGIRGSGLKDLAVSSSGAGLVAWRSGGIGNFKAVHLQEDGTFTPPERIPGPLDLESLTSELEAVARPDGGAMVAWTEQDQRGSGGTAIYASDWEP